MLALAQALKGGREWRNIRGLSYIAKEKKDSYLELPSFEECVKDKREFVKAFFKSLKKQVPTKPPYLSPQHRQLSQWIAHS